MSTTTNKAIETLNSCGLKPSMQRVSILEYLQTHPCHSMVDDVYKALGKKITTLIKTTVYNTLRLLADNKAAQMLTFVKNVETAKVFAKEGEVVWQCRNCGYIHVGKEAPKACPACLHPQSYFEVKKENW